MVRSKRHKTSPSAWLTAAVIAGCVALYAYCFYKNVIEQPGADCTVLCDDDEDD